MTLFEQNRNWFIEYTKKYINPYYEFTGKEGKHLKLLMPKIQNLVKRKFPNDYGEKLHWGFTYFIENINHDFVEKNFTLSIISCKYNEIMQNWNKPKKKQGIYDKHKHEVINFEHRNGEATSFENVLKNILDKT